MKRAKGDADAFIKRLLQLNYDAHALGLHVTGHALHKAVQKVGYEVAVLKSPVRSTSPARAGKRG